MKRLLFATAIAAAVSAPALAADVGVSISVGEPGFYGRIDIGDFPQPAVIYPRPVVIAPVPVAGPPLYLRVPPGQYKKWSKYCGRYDACGREVYFVQDHWYNDVYAPRYRERHGYDGDRHDRDRDGPQGWGDDGPGRGHGHGHGHGRGHNKD